MRTAEEILEANLPFKMLIKDAVLIAMKQHTKEALEEAAEKAESRTIIERPIFLSIIKELINELK